MGTLSVSGSSDRVNRRFNADGIRWIPDPVPRLETIPTNGIDLVDRSLVELVDYIIDLREDAAALRLTLHVTLAEVARMTGELTRSNQTVIRLHDELRGQRRAAA